MTKTLSPALIALVHITCYVDGVRTTIEPGHPVPDVLSDHDKAELKRMKSVRDPAEEDEAALVQQAIDQVAQDDFQQAREAVQAAQASTTAGLADAQEPVPAAPPAPAAPAPARKTAAKTAAKA